MAEDSEITKDSFEDNYIGTPQSISWDEYFMLQAVMASFKSKDPTTKVGCVLVDNKNHQISMGYNGFVAGIDESALPWGDEKSAPLEHQKHAYVVHAETNALMHAPRPVLGARAYVTLFPCHECAKLLASQGVKEIIYLTNKHDGQEGNRIALKIFELSGVKHRQLNVSKAIKDQLFEHLQWALS